MTSVNSTKKYSPYPVPVPWPSARVDRDWTPVLEATWAGLKARNIDPYEVPFVHRPRSELPGDGVSEGVAYGMLVALYSNDQEYFNKIWDAGEACMWNGYSYDWRVDEDGNTIGVGPASDAEQDLAIALIFADRLVEAGMWDGGHVSPAGRSYAEAARATVSAIYRRLVSKQKYLKYTDGRFNGIVNPSYFAPAFYRIFEEFEGDDRWQAVIDQSYKCLESSPGSSIGLVPDWMTHDGELIIEDGAAAASDSPGYNTYHFGQHCYKDGIRVFWRMATDALWFQEERAMQFLEKALAFARQKADGGDGSPHPNSPAHLANFFQMNGELVPLEDTFRELWGGKIVRPRREHSHLTVAMWALAAVGTGNNEAAEAYSREMASFYEGGNVFGQSKDPSGNNEDIDHNELYFDQFLAWFGVLALNGNFCNILAQW